MAAAQRAPAWEALPVAYPAIYRPQGDGAPPTQVRTLLRDALTILGDGI